MTDPLAPTATATPAGGSAAAGAPVVSRRARRANQGPDRVAVALFSVAAFLVVLALLAGQLNHVGSTHPRRALVLRRVYRTTVIERVLSSDTAGSSGGTSVSQSVSGSGSEPAPSAPLVTRTS